MNPGMCSVFGCDSLRRGAWRFNLPEDPERRLAWVQFVFEVNGQRLKESSWTDISICSEHFTEDCFETRTGTVELKARAVPSLRIKSEPEEPPDSAEAEDTADAASQSNNTYAVRTGSMCMQHSVIKEENHQQMFIVNERCLFRLFPHKCPSCGCKLHTEKVTCGLLIVLNQHCRQCGYTNQWQSQENVEAAQKAEPTGDRSGRETVSEIVTFSDEESEEGWSPVEEREEEEDFISVSGLQINELCTECGCFFNVQKPHICEHKIKPYSCNICGKRCVTELSLKTHSLTHNETYEHPCSFCYVTFKTRPDKLKHEVIHRERRDPYKCPDCPQTFATVKERRVHLSHHRTQTDVKCGVCGKRFHYEHHLRRHSVVHTGLKPFKCSFCQRGFNQQGTLKSHMRVHTGEKPFKCQRCDGSFSHNVSLRNHVQRHHAAGSESGAGGNENQKGVNSQCKRVEGDTEEKVHFQNNRRRCTGRPKGRPKKSAQGLFTLPGQKEEQLSDTITKKLKRTGPSQDEQSDSDVSFNLAEEETEKKSTRRPRGRPKTKRCR